MIEHIDVDEEGEKIIKKKDYISV